MSAIQEWHADEVIARFANATAESLEIAAKFVEEEARANLAAITDPGWGEAYRNEIVGRLLTSFVTKENKEIVAKIGVRVAGGKGGEYHGYYIELGSSTAPAHPWLRPALFENLATIQQLLGE